MSTTTPTVKLFAPVESIPILTSGRNTSGYATNHEPKYVLDNDPDSYWTTDSFSSNSIYVDLGSDKLVEAVVFWLHNYNEPYSHNKYYRVSYSTDDSTYTPFSLVLFSSRTSYSPLVVYELASGTTARYWKIEFANFGSGPIDVKPEISCLWFMNEYSLPYAHQKPELNTLLYHNNKSINRSGHRSATPADIGKQKLLQRDFIFNADLDQWNNLKNAYDVARGQNLPVIFQSDFDSDEYVAVQFDAPLSEMRIEHESWNPKLKLRELGHKRISFINRKLYPLPETVALWRFNLNGDDETDNNNDFIMDTYVDNDYTRGTTEQEITAFPGIAGRTNYIDALDATDFDMDMSDFTIELWWLVKSSLTAADASFIAKKDTGGWAVTVTSAQKIALNIGDGTTSIQLIAPDIIDDDLWHSHTIVVDRTADTVDFYLDGILTSQQSISTITGNVTSGASTDLILDARTQSSVIFWDEVCVTKRKLTATEILNRYIGRTDYGTWGI